ncbi:MAG: Npt1/Npt2 family nucleotide transporter [Myxococcota bacterium]
MASASNPFKQIVALRRNEWPLALLLFGYFFLVITTFWILKPIKKTVFIEFYADSGFELMGSVFTASQAELLAKVLNMFVALVAATAFSIMSDKLRRQQLTLAFSGVIFAGFVLYIFLLGSLSDVVVWSFYLFGDLYNTLMVATFFAFVNDSLRAEAAKRMYGVIGLGGVVGGAVGSTFVRTQIDAISYPGWMVVCLVLGVVIVGLAVAAGRIVSAQEAENPPPPPPPSSEKKEAPKGNAAIEGARLVLRSPYLLSLVALVGIYEIISTILDFQFTATIEHYASTAGLDAGKAFATTYSVTNWTALFIQFFLTSLVMQRFGVGIALLFLPVAALSGSVGFLVAPIVLMGGALSASDNAFNYSINQSAREALYTVTSREEKYKAKAFIDMFIQRSAKAVAVGINLLITSIVVGFEGVRWLSFLTIPLLIVWILIVRYLGKSFRERERAQAES